jgi:predicted nucleic acid-binding Zn ribbon protein
MERASKLIRGLRLSGDVITPEQLCRMAWPEAVGKKIAGHTRPAKLVRSRLVVEVEDQTWQRQLFTLTPHILNNLEKTLGRGLVEELEFRIVPRRRDPVLARRAVPAMPADDADGIADPVMRHLYKLSRKRAQA